MWATWCKNCLVMDQTTLADGSVEEALDGYVKIKFQAEQPDEEPVRSIMARFEAVGLPTYVILHPKTAAEAPTPATGRKSIPWYPVADHMKTRILRFLLPAILVAAGSGGVGGRGLWLEHVGRIEAPGRQSAARIDRLEGLLDELARDELTYVASGQIDNETLTSTSNRVRQIVSESSWLIEGLLRAGPVCRRRWRSTLHAGGSGCPCSENLRAGLELMAADLLFTETTRTRQTMREQLRMLRLAESNAVAEGRSDDLKQAWIVLAGVALLFAWALFDPRGGRPRHRRARSLPSRPTAERVSLNVPPPKRAGLPIDLTEAAALCTAIGRFRPNPICRDYWSGPRHCSTHRELSSGWRLARKCFRSPGTATTRDNYSSSARSVPLL